MRQITDSAVLFGDAMHPVHQNFPGLCRGNPAFPPTSETNSGRKCLNIIGAYDPAAYSFTHLTGEENCNAERVIEFLELIYKKYCNVSNIYLILDNAKYFHATKVRNWVDEHKKINIVFLTSYAPNLNLIIALKVQSLNFLSDSMISLLKQHTKTKLTKHYISSGCFFL